MGVLVETPVVIVFNALFLVISMYHIVRQRRPVELTAEQGAVRERFFARSRHSSF